MVFLSTAVRTINKRHNIKKGDVILSAAVRTINKRHNIKKGDVILSAAKDLTPKLALPIQSPVDGAARLLISYISLRARPYSAANELLHCGQHDGRRNWQNALYLKR